MKKKSVIITGITGQDGSYLAETLLEKGYKVYGLIRRSASPNHDRIKYIINDIEIVEGDLTDAPLLSSMVKTIRPAIIYNLAAQSFVKYSFENPVTTNRSNFIGVLNLLEAVRRFNPMTKFYQASSSEQFGKVRESPQSEDTPFYPRSPYGISKVASYWAVVNYRESYKIFASNGILFNHESPRRGIEFVTRKITRGAAAIKLGLQEELLLGNLDAKRDWGHAKDYVRAMILMMNHYKAEDFVIATGKYHTIRELCEIAFSILDLDWKDYVRIDKRYMRPAEVNLLLGDASKAYEKLGWEPEVSFEELITEMVESDYAQLKDKLFSTNTLLTD